MVKVILNRILVKQKELVKEHKVDGATSIVIAYGATESRQEAGINEGEVVQIGETAYKDLGVNKSPVEVGDYVLFAKFAGAGVIDPETKEKLVILNDEDVLCVIKGVQ